MSDKLMLKSVRWRNFMSYGATFSKLDFTNPGTALIVGENLDFVADGEVSSNGTGKTTAMMAVVFALYGKHLNTKISLDDLVNDINKRNLEVICEFDIGNDQYVVHRTRKTKAGAAGNTVKLIKNDKDITPDRVDACNALIAKILGIPFDIFTRIVIFSAAHIPFLELPTRHVSQVNQTEIVEHLCGLTDLAEKAEQLKLEISDVDLKIKTEKAKIDNTEAERSRYNSAVISAKQRSDEWELQKASDIERLTSLVQEANSINLDEQNELLKLVSSLEAQKSKLSQDIAALTRLQTTLNSNLKALTTEHEHLLDNKCHYCLQHFADSDEKRSICETSIASTKSDLEMIADSLIELNSERDVLDSQLSDAKSKIVVKNIDELYDIKSKESDILNQIRLLESSTNPHEPVLEELLQLTPPEVDYTTVNELTKLQSHQTFLHKLLSRNDSFIRKRLLDRNIPFLNSRLKHHLANLGMVFKVEFTHDMSVKIVRFGREINHENLSTGQKARINFALAWAFRDVYQRRYRKINVSMLDEVLDTGLDSSGIKAAVRMLKQQARDEHISMFVITHRGEDVASFFDRKITVFMEQGFSRLEDSLENDQQSTQDDIADLITL